MKKRKLIPYKNPKTRLSSSLNRNVRDISSSTVLMSYRFIVRTGKRKNSGTRAQVIKHELEIILNFYPLSRSFYIYMELKRIGRQFICKKTLIKNHQHLPMPSFQVARSERFVSKVPILVNCII
mgnify:CR=1 FL=1